MSTVLEQKALCALRQYSLFSQGDRIAVGVSGGADSVALLRFLAALRPQFGWDLVVCHIHHGLRGAEADRDECFVRALAEQLGLPCAVSRIDAAALALRDHISVEEAGRMARYAFFAQTAGKGGRIATAHTLDDSIETVLMNLVRGTGLRGLCGIPRIRGNIVRPLLDCTRAEVEDYLGALGQPYCTDSTNLTDDYTRNRIRHDAIPALQYANPAAERSIARLCRQMRAMDEWLTAEAAALLQAAAVPGGYDAATLRRAEGPVLDAALHALVSPVRDAEEKYVSLLRFLVLKGEGGVQLTPQVNYKLRDGLLVCLTGEGVQRLPAPPQPFEPGAYRLPGGYFVKFQVVKYEEFLKNQPIFKKDLNCCADCAKIQGNVILRTRQPGDFFRPGGRHLRKTLKKYYNELGIPQAERPLLPLLADGSEVLWLWGCGFAEGCAPDEYTHEVLTVRTEKTGEA